MIKMSTRKVFLMLFFILVVLFLWQVYGNKNITVDEITESVQNYGKVGAIVYILIVALGTTLFFPVSILALAGGFLFNHYLGFVVILIGSVLGAFVSFILGRYFFQDYFHKVLADYHFLKWTKTNDQKTLSNVLLLMRVLPFIPFALTNYGFGLTKMKARNYVIVTFLGLIPEMIFYALVGSSIRDPGKEKIIVAIILVVAFLVAVYIYRKQLKELKDHLFGGVKKNP